MVYMLDRLATRPSSSVIAIDTADPRPEGSWKVGHPRVEGRRSQSVEPGRQPVNLQLPARTPGRRSRCTTLDRRSSSGTWTCPVSAPPSGFAGKRDRHRDVLHVQLSFATPPTVYRYDVVTGRSKLVPPGPGQVRPGQVRGQATEIAPSKDGTKIPVFVAHKKGLKLDGTNPTLLYGYGGFNIPLTPAFSVTRVQWMEMGGVLGRRQPARRRRVWGRLAPGRHQADQAERVRRLHRGRQVPDRREVHHAPPSWPSRAAATGDSWSARVLAQRTRPVRRGPAGRRGDGHAPLPAVHRRPVLGRRLRVERQQRRVRRALQVQPLPQLKTRHQATRRRS